jgi:putative FmdB family regulatory protein
MPIYEYVCDSCGERSEVLQRRSDPTPLCTTQKCDDGALVRVMSAHVVGIAPQTVSCASNGDGCRPCGKAGTGCGG